MMMQRRPSMTAGLTPSACSNPDRPATLTWRGRSPLPPRQNQSLEFNLFAGNGTGDDQIAGKRRHPGHAANAVAAQVERRQGGADPRLLVAVEAGAGILDAGDDRPPVDERTAKSDQQAFLVGAHRQRLDVQPAFALDLAYPGGGGKFGVRGGQGALQAADHPGIDDAVALDAETHQPFPGFSLVAVAVAGMRGDGVNVAGPIDGDALEVVKLPEIAVTPRPERGIQRRVPDAAGLDAQQAERMLLFVLDDDEAAVGEAMDAGRLMDAGQGLKARGSFCATSIVSSQDCRRPASSVSGAGGRAIPPHRLAVRLPEQQKILRGRHRDHFLRLASLSGNVFRHGNETAEVHLRSISMPCGPDRL